MQVVKVHYPVDADETFLNANDSNMLCFCVDHSNARLWQISSDAEQLFPPTTMPLTL